MSPTDLVTPLVSGLTTDLVTRTDGRTNEESTYPPLKSFTSVTRTRAYRVIAGFQPSAALRASLNRRGAA